MKKIVLFISLFIALGVYADQTKVYRAYNKPSGGFVIMDDHNEVAAFSETGSIEEGENPFESFLGENAPRMEIIQVQADEPRDFPLAVKDSVGPLLGDIRYNQEKPYFNKTPLYGDKHCVTGCVATAIAQIMRYWEWPKVCIGGYEEYYASRISQTVGYNFENKAFDWENMKPQYSGTEAEQQNEPDACDAVAELMLACGVGVHMGYGPDGSGANSNNVVNAMIKHFNYKNTMTLQSVAALETTNKFISTLYADLDAGRPIYCDGYENGKTGEDAFHAYVIDGYILLEGDNRDNPQILYIHFNFGWGGSRNGWYRIKGKDDRSFYSTLNVLTNIAPNDGTDLAENSVVIKDGKIRDILGREVEQTIPGQMYIRDGKKFVTY